MKARDWVFISSPRRATNLTNTPMLSGWLGAVDGDGHRRMAQPILRA